MGTQVSYTRSKPVLLAGHGATADDAEQAVNIISNWRSSHSYPLLATRMSLKGRAVRVDSDALVAQRLKRLSSIEAKLRRNATMKLSQMQDIGGCRAVVRDLPAMRELWRMYADSIERSRTDRPECCEVYDYITNPKPDGYRGLHLVYKYHTRADYWQDVYDGMRVEIQIRSRLQHIWATAVETVGAFTRQALKSGIGAEPWKRFFVLMSAALAFRESAPRVPHAPRRKAELVRELRELTGALNALKILEGMQAVVEYGSKHVEEATLFLLELDANTGRVTVWGFDEDQEAEANAKYLEVERSIADSPGMQAVLVSVESLAALPKAYPNYYADTAAFTDELSRAIWS